MNEIRSKQEKRIVTNEVKKKNRMTICISIDVHKKKCIATLEMNRHLYNNGHGIKEFIEHIKLYGESATAA